MSKISYCQQANQLRREGQLDRVIALYREAIKLYPDFAQYYYQLGKNIVEIGGPIIEPIDLYRKAIELQPSYSWFHYDLGLLLLQQASCDEAANCFEIAIELQPDFYQFYNMLGEVKVKQGFLDEAISSFKKATELAPYSSIAYQKLADLLCKQQKLNEAEELYKKAISLKPYSAGLHYYFGNILVEKGKLNEAVNSIQKAIDINPKAYPYYHRLGVVFKMQNQINEAVSAFTKVTEIAPKYWQSYYELGEIFRQQGNYELALDAQKNVVQLNPNFFYSHFYLGNILEVKEQFEDAALYYISAIQINPKLASQLKLIDKLKHHYDNAINSLREEVTLNPKNFYAHRNLAQFLEKIGLLDEAVIYYQKAVDLDPEEALGYASLGQILEKQNKTDEAVECYQKYINLVSFTETKYIEKKYFFDNYSKKNGENIRTKNKTKRLIVTSSIMHLVNVISTLRYQQNCGEYTDSKDILLLINSSELELLINIASVWDFSKIIPGLGYANLFKDYDLSLKTKVDLLQKQLNLDLDVVYVHTNFQLIYKECLKAYPKANKIVYGDTLGQLVLQESANVDQAYLIMPLERSIGAFTKCNIKLVKPEYYQSVVKDIFYKNIKGINEYCQQVQQYFNQKKITVCTTGYYTKAGFVKGNELEIEKEAYLEVALSHTKPGEAVLIKGHPGGLGKEIAKMLLESLLNNERDAILLDEKFAGIPIDLFCPGIKFNKAIVFVSTSAISLAYLTQCDVVLGFSDRQLQKYFSTTGQNFLKRFQKIYYIQTQQAYRKKFEPVRDLDINDPEREYPSFPVYLTYKEKQNE